nr:immunoglobulin heavy chain junction region [Macaca mulatta]MOV46975.1 immunoglobulin heavy chain junction region [Macaca mulatta]
CARDSGSAWTFYNSFHVW